MPTPAPDTTALDLSRLEHPTPDLSAALDISRDQLPHMVRYVLDKDGSRFIADSNRDLQAALDEISGPKTVVYALLHRKPNGSDSHEEVTSKFNVT